MRGFEDGELRVGEEEIVGGSWGWKGVRMIRVGIWEMFEVRE